MNGTADADGIPTQWPVNYALRAKDGLAMVSFIVFLMVSLYAALQTVTYAFGLTGSGPLRDRSSVPQTCQFLAAFIVVNLLFGLVGKYLWLLCMCRFLDRASVGPLISYGIPRRISAFDRRFVVRFYHDAGLAPEARLASEISVLRLYWRLPIASAAGAVIFFGVAYFHLVSDEPRFWRGGLTFTFIALILGTSGYWASRASR